MLYWDAVVKGISSQDWAPSLLRHSWQPSWWRICLQCRRPWFHSWVGNIPPGEGVGYPLQYSCLENPQGQRSLVGCSPQGCKESDTTEQLLGAQHWEKWLIRQIQRRRQWVRGQPRHHIQRRRQWVRGRPWSHIQRRRQWVRGRPRSHIQRRRQWVKRRPWSQKPRLWHQLHGWLTDPVGLIFLMC